MADPALAARCSSPSSNLLRKASGAWSLVAVLALLLSGCATPEIVRFPGPTPVLPEGSRELPMFDGSTGDPVSWDALVQKALAVDVVLIGELHHHELGMGASAALFEDLLAARPDGPEVALEFLERDKQPLIDDFADEIISEREFVSLARLSPGNYPWGHRAMVLAAIAAGQPVWAANAPRRYVSLGRKKGYERLAEIDAPRSALVKTPEFEIGGEYRRRFGVTMNADRLGDEIVDKFFRSQSLWDATMADTVLTALKGGASPIVLVIGRFHIAHDGGTLQRVRAANPSLNILTVAIDDSHAERLAATDVGLAKVVIYAGGFSDG